MPEVLPPNHPIVMECQQLGPGGFQTRLDLTGGHPVAVCLFHGVGACMVQYSLFTPVVGNHAIGQPVVIVNVVSPCWPQCGARFEWRS